MKLLSVNVNSERGVVDARFRVKQVAALLRLAPQEQVRVATVVSELARNALRYAGGGKVDISADTSGYPHLLAVSVSDSGPGIPNLDLILQGGYHSKTGMGLGLAGSKRLMDVFEVDTSPTGTTVRVAKRLPSGVSAHDVQHAVAELTRTQPRDAVTQLQAQNQELLDTLAVLGEREERLRSLNQELEDTNRGVVALYAELEEKAERLREANQIKSKFLSYMSHEFRTPLHSILGLARILLARLDGELTDEQQKQVQLIQGAAGDLLEMVNDLLDLAKVEAGRTEVQVTTFDVAQLFGALRALFQPIITNPDVKLVFDEPQGVLRLTTDEGKVSQVLRNFISNALKFTVQGEVRVSAALSAERRVVRFAVHDTGIGIPLEEQRKLFQDFTQVSSALVNGQKGSGLGLSIAQKLTELLGGQVGLRSAPDEGSLFYAEIPLEYRAGNTAAFPLEAPDEPEAPRDVDDAVDAGGVRPLVLVVDDNEADRYVLTNLLTREHFAVEEAHHGAAGLARAQAGTYHAILLDLSMPELGGLDVLRRLRSQPDTRHVPVLIVTSQVLQPAERQAIEALRATAHDKARLYRGDTAELLATLWRAVQSGRTSA